MLAKNIEMQLRGLLQYSPTAVIKHSKESASPYKYRYWPYTNTGTGTALLEKLLRSLLRQNNESFAGHT